MPTNSSRRPSSTSIPTPNARGILRRRRQPGFHEHLVNRFGRTDGSRNGRNGRRAHAGENARRCAASGCSPPDLRKDTQVRRQTCGRSHEGSAHRGVGLGLGLFGVPRPSGRAGARSRIWRRRVMSAASIIRATTRSSITAASSIPDLSMTPCWPRPSDASSCGSRIPICPVQRAGISRTRCRDDLTEVKKLADDKREAAEIRPACCATTSFQLAADPTKTSGMPTALSPVPGIRFVAARCRRRAAERKREGL